VEVDVRDRNWRRWRRSLVKADAARRAASLGITSERWIGMAATTPHDCSRFCCGNPRAFGQGGRIGEDVAWRDEEW
jgi:hypothetical protein